MWHESITKASLNLDDPLGEAFRLLLGFVQRLRAGEEQQLLRGAAAASAFLSYTGQLYSFEEFRRGPSPIEAQVSHYARERRLLEHMRESLPSEEMKEALTTAIAALGFVESTGQREGVEDYLEYWRNNTLPPVVAAFKTHEEAEAWLNARTPLPYRAKVLIFRRKKVTRHKSHPGRRKSDVTERASLFHCLGTRVPCLSHHKALR